MIDIEGLALTDLDRQRLAHPLVGGLILFSRNYASPGQLEALSAEIHAIREPRLPIAVDHEGGRVQRFRDGFTRLPAMRLVGQLWDRDRSAAISTARGIGYVLAAELRASGVDLSFSPVLDLDYGSSAVIGDRAFHRQPAAVVEMAGALIEGLHQAGMAACGKHFPGHGWVAADSHVAIPVDDRDYAAIAAEDIEPYRRLKLDAVMPAHVIYPKVDANPAGFSKVWIEKLRLEFGCDGVIFSDDLSMEGASIVGGIVARATAAWTAGCDMLLVCNSPALVEELLLNWPIRPDPLRSRRIERLLPWQPASTWQAFQEDPAYQAGLAGAAKLLPAQ
jgi:beta-N-acetylhexosaminidase